MIRDQLQVQLQDPVNGECACVRACIRNRMSAGTSRPFTSTCASRGDEY